TAYHVHWTPLQGVTLFELQEATRFDFSDAVTQAIAGVNAIYTHTATTQPVQYFYRVRGVSPCSDDRGPYSDVVGMFVIPAGGPATQAQARAEVGALTNVVKTRFIPGSSTPAAVTVTVNNGLSAVTP